MLDRSIDAQAILRERAHVLARRPVPAQQLAQSLEVLVFQLASERFAFPLAQIQGVHPLQQMVPLPGMPDFVSGMTYLQGRLLPLVNLARLLRLPVQGIQDSHRYLLIGDDQQSIGLLVGNVEGIQQLARQGLSSPPATLDRTHRQFLLGVSAEPLVVLDGPRLLADPRLSRPHGTEKHSLLSDNNVEHAATRLDPQ